MIDLIAQAEAAALPACRRRPRPQVLAQAVPAALYNPEHHGFEHVVRVALHDAPGEPARQSAAPICRVSRIQRLHSHALDQTVRAHGNAQPHHRWARIGQHARSVNFDDLKAALESGDPRKTTAERADLSLRNELMARLARNRKQFVATPLFAANDLVVGNGNGNGDRPASRR